MTIKSVTHTKEQQRKSRLKKQKEELNFSEDLPQKLRENRKIKNRESVSKWRKKQKEKTSQAARLKSLVFNSAAALGNAVIRAKRALSAVLPRTPRTK